MAKKSFTYAKTLKYLVLPILLTIIVVAGVLIYKHSYINRAISGKNNDKVSESQKDSQVETNTKAISFNTETRVVSSPVITNEDGSKYEFSIYLPKEWNLTKNSLDNDKYFINLQKGEYVVTISNLLSELNVCDFKNGYEQVNSNLGTLRLEKQKNEFRTMFSVCHYNKYPFGSRWDDNTSLGYIYINVPENYSQTTINEIKDVIKGITYSK